jgi:hypothetical protein
MIRRGSAFGWACITVMAAHALAFVVIRVLPDPAMNVLGFRAGQVEARASFEEQNRSRSYGKVLVDLARGDLGQTIDRVAVNAELAVALKESAPRIAVAAALVLLAILGVAFAPALTLPRLSYFGSMVAFIPPFVASFILLGVLLIANASASLLIEWWVCTFAMAIPAAALCVSQSCCVPRGRR